MHPEHLSDEQLVELRETVTRFPFFGAAQIALTRAFKARQDVQFTDQLSQAAIYTGHRASLYTRLKSINAVEPAAPEEHPLPTAEEPTLASLIIENEDVSIAELAPEKIEPLDIATIVQVEEVLVQIETVEQKLEETVEQIIEETAEQPTAIKLSELDPLEAQFLVSALNTSMEMEVQPEPTSKDENQLPEADLEPHDENSYAALIYRRAQRKHMLGDESASHASAREEDSQEEPDTENLPAFQSTPLSHGVQRIRSTDSKQHQRDLIDRFIHTEPQIARGKAGDYTAGNVAKDSLEEDFSMVTETIAILFAKQGKLDKARKAFRKLMEQHPEKSIYFAAQLKNLEQFKK